MLWWEATMAKRRGTRKQTTMNVSLPASQRAFVEREVRRGGFANMSEYIRHLLREHRDQQAPPWLEDKIEAALEGPFEVADDAWWAARAAKLEASIKEARGSKRTKRRAA